MLKNVLIILSAVIISFLIFYSFFINQDITEPQIESEFEVSQELEMLDQDTEPKYYTTISINYLQTLDLKGSEITIEEELAPGSNYKRFIASYISENNKIYGLLTVPDIEVPENGFKAVVFNHGYIPPSQYVTTEKYVAYVDYLARNEFVVFKIDLRGHGKSEGNPTGSYFSPGYTIDAINALKSLQNLEYVDKDGIGMWGHSMAGNLVLRAMLVSEDVKASVIWAGAVYSYADFAKYRLSDSSYVPRQRPPEEERERVDSSVVSKLRENSDEIDFDSPLWKSISLTKNIDQISGPLQLHHAVNDDVVNIGYQRDLVEVLKENEIKYEDYEYDGGGHNINSPYFETAMQRTVNFFKENL